MSWTRFAACLVLLLAPLALAGPRKPSVLVIHAGESAPRVADVTTKLQSSGLFSAVDTFDAHASTPTIDLLTDYDAALVWNYLPWADRAALGTVLAQYVDFGYGVVQTLFTTGGAAGSNLAGNWTASYNAITFGGSTSGGSPTLGAVALPDHPVMNGVAELTGTNFTPRPSNTTLQFGATLVASWSDGKPLVAAGPKVNRIDLGLYPPSSDASAAGWSGDGVKLMANALMATIRPKILLCVSTPKSFPDPDFTDPTNRLYASGLFSSVSQFNASTGTPSLEVLKGYDAVLTWSSIPYHNAAAMGDVLADYVDAGYGVVVAGDTNMVNSKSLGGRWASDGYELITPSANYWTGSASLGTIWYSTHPIMNGVSTFHGGLSSFRPTSTALPSHGFPVASWNDGKILVAASTKFHNRADLGFYPPSNVVLGSFWDGSTDGGKLMANALLYTIRPFVGILHSESDPADASALASRLMQLRRFSGVSVLTTLKTTTPLATSIRPFSSILFWGHDVFADSTTVGNRLADYVDAGGSVVEGVFSTTASIGLDNARPRGRWISQGYDITPEGSTSGTTGGPATLGPAVGPAHPVTTFVLKFNGGSTSFRQSNNPNFRGRRLLNWSDGKMLASLHSFRRRVDLDFWPVSSIDNPNGWIANTDGKTLIANALTFASAMKPCPGDLNGDGLVDDADFLLFVIYYNTLLDPRGDLTGDNLTEDADFSIFANSYDALTCP